jgi:glycosyltransferase involved in cell wall biosynthesis
VNRARIGVLHVVHSLHVGGAEKLVHDLALRTDSTRFAVCVACLDDAGPLAPSLAAAGVPVEVLERRPGLDARVVQRLRRLIVRHGVEVVHAHQYTPFFYGVTAARLAGARCLFTEHGRHHPDVRKPKRVAANQVLARLAQATVAVSAFTRRALIENDGFSPERVSVLYNGVETRGRAPVDRAEARARLGLPSDAPVVGVCARLSPEKNLPMLVDAFARVRQLFPTARLVIAGDGPARADVVQSVAARGLEGVVHLPGFVSDVPGLMPALDVFALSSLTEGTSITLLEAMLAGRPAVVTDVGGNPEIAVEGETAWLVPSGDTEAFADRIARLFASPAQANAFGAAARARVEARFTFEGMVRGYEALYVG